MQSKSSYICLVCKANQPKKLEQARELLLIPVIKGKQQGYTSTSNYTSKR